jgi:hypothetical protein
MKFNVIPASFKRSDLLDDKAESSCSMKIKAHITPQQLMKNQIIITPAEIKLLL